MPPSVIETRGLGKRYAIGAEASGSLREAITATVSRRGRRPRREFWALSDVDLTVTEGESVGIVGRNGSGKSTLLRLLSRITEPTTGFARTRGRVGTLLEVGTGFHPELTGRENVFLNGAILGMRRREIRGRFDEIVAFAGVGRFLDTPLKRYSTGMQLRLAFAIAAHLDPEILIVDEVLAVGDAEFQRRCVSRMSELTGEGRTVLFVSHDLDAVAQLCPRTVWLDAGVVRRDGDSEDVVGAYTADRSDGVSDVSHARDSGLPGQVLGVSLIGGAFQGTGAIRREVPLSVNIRFAIDETAGDADLRVWLINDRGVRVLDDCWSDGARRPAGPLSAGDYRARVMIPPLLTPGAYQVGVWLGTPLEVFSNREFLSFTVLPHPEDSSEETSRVRAVRPPVDWIVEREAEGIP